MGLTISGFQTYKHGMSFHLCLYVVAAFYNIYYASFLPLKFVPKYFITLDDVVYKLFCLLFTGYP